AHILLVNGERLHSVRDNETALEGRVGTCSVDVVAAVRVFIGDSAQRQFPINEWDIDCPLEVVVVAAVIGGVGVPGFQATVEAVKAWWNRNDSYRASHRGAAERCALGPPKHLDALDVNQLDIHGRADQSLRVRRWRFTEVGADSRSPAEVQE